MRIISGEKRGMKLFSPKDNRIRPTSDSFREAMFNQLHPLRENAVVLDLFGGTGAISIEFLSRGAMRADINDASSDSVRLILRNLEHVGYLDRAVVTKSDAMRRLKKALSQGERYDYIFVDPPYGKNLVHSTLTRFPFCDILKKNGILITEQEKEEPPVDCPGLLLVDHRRHGSKSLHMYKGVTDHAGDLSGEF